VKNVYSEGKFVYAVYFAEDNIHIAYYRYNKDSQLDPNRWFSTPRAERNIIRLLAKNQAILDVQQASEAILKHLNW